jgi:hypothetical protein
MPNSKNQIVYFDNWLKVFQTLNESQKRWFSAQKALEIGHGGIQKIHSLTGLSRTTIFKGIDELQASQELSLSSERVRLPGGGRKKKAIDPDSPLLRDLEKIMDSNTAGDPMKPLKWTLKSTRTLADELKECGHTVSPMTVCRLLHKLDYSLRGNIKTIEPGSDHPDRDKQFQHINATVEKFQKSEAPVISVDAKKKELVGNFKNKGEKWEKIDEPTMVSAYDFLNLASGNAIPYGMYDIQRNEGMVNVGMSRDTAEFAVSSIRQWWKTVGKIHYRLAKKLLICCDGGGSNASRSRGWKFHLQELSDEIGLRISVCHYPPGTSKWNKIEHRMFSFISMNWKGQPLVNYETVVNLIEGTTNRKGLQVKACLDEKTYEIGIKIPEKAMNELQVHWDKEFPRWNYTIKPRTKPTKMTKYSTK